ncbi:hypothetical protein Tco_0731963 [Tanacetum coccineum]
MSIVTTKGLLMKSRTPESCHGYAGNQGYVRNSGNVTTVGNYTSTAGRNRGNTVNAGNQMGNAVIGLSITPGSVHIRSGSWIQIDCEKEFNASAIFLAMLTQARSATETNVGPSYDTDALLKPVCVNDSYVEEMDDNNILSDIPNMNTNTYDVAPNDPSLAQEDVVLMILIENMQRKVERCNTVNQETKYGNKSLTMEPEQYKEKVKLFEKKNEYANNVKTREKDLETQLQTAIIRRNFVREFDFS